PTAGAIGIRPVAGDRHVGQACRAALDVDAAAEEVDLVVRHRAGVDNQGARAGDAAAAAGVRGEAPSGGVSRDGAVEDGQCAGAVDAAPCREAEVAQGRVVRHGAGDQLQRAGVENAGAGALDQAVTDGQPGDDGRGDVAADVEDAAGVVAADGEEIGAGAGDG